MERKAWMIDIRQALEAEGDIVKTQSDILGLA